MAMALWVYIWPVSTPPPEEFLSSIQSLVHDDREKEKPLQCGHCAFCGLWLPCLWLFSRDYLHHLGAAIIHVCRHTLPAMEYITERTHSSYFQLDTRSNRAAIEGAMNGLYTAGGLVGALTSSVMADRFGRKRVIFGASIMATIGGALQGGSVDLGMFIFVRFVSGFGVGEYPPLSNYRLANSQDTFSPDFHLGIILVLIPMYQTEVSPPHSRGMMVGLHGAVITLGFTTGSWIGYGFYFVNANGAQWRVPLILQAVPPLILTFGVLFLPESPRWCRCSFHSPSLKIFGTI
jgi:MFS family permease